MLPNYKNDPHLLASAQIRFILTECVEVIVANSVWENKTALNECIFIY